MRRSFRFLIPAALAWLVAACGDAPPPTDAETVAEPPTYAGSAAAARVDVRDRWIVVFNDRVASPAEEARSLVQAHGGTLHFTYQHTIRGFAATLSPGAVEALRRNPNVKYVEADDIVTLQSTQNGAPWGLDRSDQRSLPLSTTYSYANTGQGVNVYVLDGGIRYSHAEFGGRAVFGADFVGDGRGGADCYGHGTHVAGIIGGATYGVARGAKLYSVRVVSCTNVTSSSNVVAGLEWIGVNRVKPAVVNMSMTTPDNLAQDDAVKALLADGVTVVSAAGNVTFTQPGNIRQEDVCNASSAYVTGVIAVGATDQSDTRWANSNIGYCMDVFAPGVNITSADYLSATGAIPLSGTSMAAAHVTGAVARYLQTNPGATPTQTHAWVVNSATAGVVVNPGHLSPNRLLYVDPNLGVTAPTANISGPTSITSAGTYTWAANAAGGNGSYTYSWEYRVQGGAWSVVGSGSSYSRSVAAGNASFELRVTVTSAGLSGSDPSHLVSVNIPTAPAVTIAGPTAISTAGTYTWTASASGGNGSYTYSWEYRVSGGAWSVVGSASSYSRSVAAGNASFEVRVTVTSAGLTASATRAVTVSIPTTSPLAVTISGPDYVDGGTSNTWTANPTGGTGRYTYQWQHRLATSTTWSAVLATTKSYTRSVGLRAGSFYLRATVTSGGVTTYKDYYVYVEPVPIDNPMCGDVYC